MLISLAYALLSGAHAALTEPTVWPMPQSASFQKESVPISSQLKFRTSGDKHIGTLQRAFERYSSLMFQHKSSDNQERKHVEVEVSVKDDSESYPQLDTDESYSLVVSTTTENPSITITANTVYGALYGLETLSQLVFYDFDSHSYYVWPCEIQDAPRYAHRGMLLDTSRHYESIPNLKRVVDSLSYAKYNVLHWHVVDTQSFPFESTTAPELWKGSYTYKERYTQDDIKELVEYGRDRGVKVWFPCVESVV